jgi:DNA helicase II / ATP-dependent DNA helicase PcrA
LQEISLITDADKYDEEKPAVTLMTIHGSKGLEFPVVFIVGLEEHLIPMGGRDGEEANIEEERRLFYVAITRAEEQLFFSHCRIRFKFGEETRQMRSRFLNEVDPGVVRTETGASIDQNSSEVAMPAKIRSSSYQIEYDWEKPKTTGNKKSGQNSSHTIEYEYDNGDDPFQTGTKVMHARFGQGKILSRSGTGPDARVVVFFKGRGRKTLVLRAAKLKVLH